MISPSDYPTRTVFPPTQCRVPTRTEPTEDTETTRITQPKTTTSGPRDETSLEAMHSLDQNKSSPALFRALMSSLTMQLRLRFRLAYAPTPHSGRLGLDERLALLDVLLEPEAGQRGFGWCG
jgi:hypothetical protein